MEFLNGIYMCLLILVQMFEILTVNILLIQEPFILFIVQVLVSYPLSFCCISYYFLSFLLFSKENKSVKHIPCKTDYDVCDIILM